MVATSGMPQMKLGAGTIVLSTKKKKLKIMFEFVVVSVKYPSCSNRKQNKATVKYNFWRNARNIPMKMES